ncbi:MAG TPA: 30S ribosomal protein S16 [Anaerolineae bacterium]|nr:30S ribosomal protein S16 [Anaerolineae bacterium]
MIKIRLRRVGGKKQPHYRVVVADARSPRDGRFIEIIGHLDPRQDPPAFHIAEERAIHWLQQGAQPTEAVVRMLNQLGTYQKVERVKAGESLEEIMAEMRVEVAERERVAEKTAEPPRAEEAAEEPAREEIEGPGVDTPVAELGLSSRIVKSLSGADVDTVRDLVDKLAEGREAVLGISGLGEKSLVEIEEVLKAHGLLE